MIDKIQHHFGFTQMPFGRDLAPAMLHRHAAHAQAAARITWTITERTLGVITGEVGTGKTVAARAALAGIDPTRHTVIYLGNPATGVRGIHHHIVTSLGGRPAHGTATLTAQAYDVLAGRRPSEGPVPDVRPEGSGQRPRRSGSLAAIRAATAAWPGVTYRCKVVSRGRAAPPRHRVPVPARGAPPRAAGWSSASSRPWPG